MHPRVFLDSFWRNDLKDEIFVAMSFDPRYDERWRSIFVPAIEGEPIAGKALKAIRVDIRRSGDSILTEITNGIAHSQCVLADVSVTDTLEVEARTLWFRNANVMYEVGLAAACRQPVEIILVRDDDRPLLFDISTIPVMRFEPTAIQDSVSRIRSAFADRLRERELIKDLRFAATIESLAQFEINMIRQNADQPVLCWQGPSYPPAVALSLPALLQKRILRLIKPATSSVLDLYTWTAFGRAVADYIKTSKDAET